MALQRADFAHLEQRGLRLALIRCGNRRLVVVFALLSFPLTIDPRLRILVLLLAVAVVEKSARRGRSAGEGQGIVLAWVARCAQSAFVRRDRR